MFQPLELVNVPTNGTGHEPRNETVASRCAAGPYCSVCTDNNMAAPSNVLPSANNYYWLTFVWVKLAIYSSPFDSLFE